jgi:hypothetical protein
MGCNDLKCSELLVRIGQLHTAIGWDLRDGKLRLASEKASILAEAARSLDWRVQELSDAASVKGGIS